MKRFPSSPGSKLVLKSFSPDVSEAVHEGCRLVFAQSKITATNSQRGILQTGRYPLASSQKKAYCQYYGSLRECYNCEDGSAA